MLGPKYSCPYVRRPVILLLIPQYAFCKCLSEFIFISLFRISPKIHATVYWTVLDIWTWHKLLLLLLLTERETYPMSWRESIGAFMYVP